MSMLQNVSANTSTNDTVMLASEKCRVMMEARIPSIAISLVSILVGVSGNAFVIHIYRKNSSLRSRLFYFIPWLAFFDINAIITIGTFSILQDIFSMCFPSLFLCQTLWFGVIFCTTSGASCLLLIAVQRYCFVFQKPVFNHRKWHRLFISIIVTFAVVFAIPVFFIVDLREIKVTGVNGLVCGDTLKKYKHIYKYIYFHTLLSLACINIITITILYVRIGLKTYKMSTNENPQSPRRTSGLKFTLMYIVVFIIYVVAYIPSFMTIVLPDETKTELFHTLENKPALIAILVAHRMFIFSHVLNPFIFYVFHARYRKEIKKYFGNCVNICVTAPNNSLF